MQTAEPLVPELRCFEADIAIEKSKGYKSAAIEQILAEPIQV
jgi:hypothetical protein